MAHQLLHTPQHHLSPSSAAGVVGTRIKYEPGEGFKSQDGQDKWAQTHVFSGQETGVYVDIGCYDGIAYSNTWYFEKVKHWQVNSGYSKALALIWYRALTWHVLPLSSPRTHFEPWKAVGTRGRGSLAARQRVAVRPAQQTVMLAKSTKLKQGTKLGPTLCYIL